MRIIAQFSLVLAGLYAALMLIAWPLLWVAPFVTPILLVPVVWYVVFNRHREPTLDLEPLLLELRFIRNAISELDGRRAGERRVRPGL